jgi:3',5'-cyclic AMP phosphodiesterase CpdA
MEPKPLLTMLHVSDLHIGEIDSSSGDALYAPASLRVLANCSWFDGVVGHHARGLEDLASFYNKQLRKLKPNLAVIVSGDLTRVGNDPEFTNARDFLYTRLALPHRSVGLELNSTNTTMCTIPGNHDHWPGSERIFGGPHPRFNAEFPAGSLPYVYPISLSNGRTLQIVGLNTDADVSPRGIKRLFAIGSFQSQLNAAAAKLGPPDGQCVRVLLMHHSWEHRGWALRIDSGTRDALERFMRDHNIRLLLTGHTHSPTLNRFVPKGGQETLECRCGTTTQMGRPSYAWRTLFGSFPTRQWSENTFMVHRLYDKGEQVQWNVETYQRFDGSGFGTIGALGTAQIIV